MPDQISVSEFVAETHEDYKAPTASSFTTRTAQCRNTVAAIEEVSGSLGGAGRAARAAGIALRPGTRSRLLLLPDAHCPPPAPTPGKSFCSPRAGSGRASSARHRSPLFPERWLWGEAVGPPWAFWGEPSCLLSFPSQGFRSFAPHLGKVNFGRRVRCGCEPGTPARAAAPGGGSPLADLSNLFLKWPGGGSCAP